MSTDRRSQNKSVSVAAQSHLQGHPPVEGAFSLEGLDASEGAQLTGAKAGSSALQAFVMMARMNSLWWRTLCRPISKGTCWSSSALVSPISKKHLSVRQYSSALAPTRYTPDSASR
jgi:hypothetical protein